MQRVAIVATASGCGKTTVGRALAAILGAPFVELDAIHWQAGWSELDAAELRRRVEPLVERDAWVVDGAYRGKLGDLVLEARGHGRLARPPAPGLAPAPRPAGRCAAR